MSHQAKRIYGGVSAQERRDHRRAALIESGLELFGTLGYPNVSIKRICDEAGLTQRYFYESFTDREALLDAVYRHCFHRLQEATNAAAMDYLAGLPDVVDRGALGDTEIHGLADAAFGTFLRTLTADPRQARVILIEVVGVSPALEQLRIGAIHQWADLIIGLSGQANTGDRARHKLAAIGVVGAITQLLIDWQMAASSPISPDDGPDLFTVDAIHAVITDLLVATYDQLLRS